MYKTKEQQLAQRFVRKASVTFLVFCLVVTPAQFYMELIATLRGNGLYRSLGTFLKYYVYSSYFHYYGVILAVETFLRIELNPRLCKDIEMSAKYARMICLIPLAIFILDATTKGLQSPEKLSIFSLLSQATSVGTALYISWETYKLTVKLEKHAASLANAWKKVLSATGYSEDRIVKAVSNEK